MTNLEYYANERKLKTNRLFCFNAYICKHGKECSGFACSSCELCRNMNECVKSMLAEHKEPIKLKQWEYDLIKYHGNFAKFNDISILMAMKCKGHFKDMNSAKTLSMTIKEILENCEVIE